MPTVTQPSGNQLFLGNFIAYLGDLDANGLPTAGLRDIGNCSEISLTFEEDILEKFERRTSARGLYGSVAKQSKISVKLKLDEINIENLLVHHLATEAAYGQSSGTATTATLAASAVQGLYFSTGKRAITVTNVKVGATTMTLTTDYTVDSALGLIYVVPGGGIVNGDALTWTGTYTAVASRTVRIAKAPNVKRYILLRGDPTAGPTIDLELWRVHLTPDGDVGLITDEYAGLGLTGAVQLDTTNHPLEPWGRVIERVAA